MADMAGLHIVIVPAWWPSPEQPMAGVFCADYVAAFAAAGAKVGVVFPDLVSLRFLGHGTSIPWRPRLSEESCAGAPVIRIRGLHTAVGRPWLQMHRYLRWLRRGLSVYQSRYGSPDALHAMCAVPAGWACTRLASSLARRVIVTEHTGPFSLALEPPAARRYVFDALRDAAAVFAVSDSSAEEMRAAGVNQPISVCGNPLAEVFLASTLPDGREEGSPRALFVGRLVAGKGVGDLLDAVTSLGPAFDAEWHFVGEGPMSPVIQSRFAAAGLGERLHMHGYRDRAGVARLMARSDFLVLPTHGETFGVVVAEALCMGLPVVTTRGTACGDFVGGGEGALAEIGDVESLEAAIRRVAAGLGGFDGKAIASRARERFSGSAVAARYAEVFRGCLSTSTGSIG